MHNQDTTKDDILEALFELSKMAKEFIENHIKEIKEEREKARIQAEALEAMKQLNGDKTEDLLEDPHRLFKAAMKHIEQNTDNEQIKNMAKLFHDNPLDGIKLIDEVTNHQRQEQAFELSEASKEIIENLKKAQQLNSEKVTPDPQTEQLLSNLIEQEQGKLETAASFLNHEIDLSKSPINSISSDDVKEIVQMFKEYVSNENIESDKSEVLKPNKEETKEKKTSNFQELLNQYNEESWNVQEYRKNNELIQASSNHELEKELFGKENGIGLAIGRSELAEKDKQHISNVITNELKQSDSEFINDDRGILMISENKFYVNQHHKDEPAIQKSHVFEIIPYQWIDGKTESHEIPESYIKITYDFNEMSKTNNLEPSIKDGKTEAILNKAKAQSDEISVNKDKEIKRDFGMER